MVFQSYALFPHLDVFENVAFGLRARGADRADIARRVARAIELVDLGGYERRRVQALSGGQQQRVALARALAPEPPVLLLDEPLSNLDAALRERTRAELRSLVKRLGITTVFVTHDQEEAFALSDRIAVMNAARMEQVGSPEMLYFRPATPFVASFVGKANFLPATVEAVDGEEVTCRLPGGAYWRVRAVAGRGASFARGDNVRVMTRPESLRVSRNGAVGGGERPDAIPARVAERRFAGATTVYRLAAPGVPEELLAWGEADAASPGDEVVLERVAGAVAWAFPHGPEGE